MLVPRIIDNIVHYIIYARIVHNVDFSSDFSGWARDYSQAVSRSVLLTAYVNFEPRGEAGEGSV